MSRKSQIASVVLSFIALACGGGGSSSNNPAALRVSGLVAEIAGGCPELRFKLGTEAVSTSQNSVFGDASCQDLRNGMAIEVEGEWQSEGSVRAQRVRPQPQPPQVHLEGKVSELRGTCPDLSFLLGAERVLTNASTRFERVSCGLVGSGQLLEIHGVRQADGTVLAREVEPRREGEDVEVIGTLTGLDGSCPDLRFSLGSDRITTDRDTRFKELACNGLRSGQFVRIEGTHQADGTILAREVETQTRDRRG